MNVQDEALLIGLHIGDGYLGEWEAKFKNKRWIQRKWIFHAGLDEGLALNVKNLVEKFGFKSSIFFRDKKYYIAQCVGIWHIIKKYFSQPKNTYKVDIPKVFLGNRRLMKLVIRGIFSSDGSLSKMNKRKGIYLSIDSKSKNLIKRIYEFLIGLKYIAYFYYFKTQDFYSVRIYRKHEILKFMKDIGSLNPRHYDIIAGVA